MQNGFFLISINFPKNKKKKRKFFQFTLICFSKAFAVEQSEGKKRKFLLSKCLPY